MCQCVVALGQLQTRLLRAKIVNDVDSSVSPLSRLPQRGSLGVPMHARGNKNVASHALKFCTENFFPDSSSMVAESTIAKPAFTAAWQRTSGDTRVMTDARVPKDV